LISLQELLLCKVVTIMIYNLKYKENWWIINYFVAIYLDPCYMCLLNAASKKKLLFICLQHGYFHHATGSETRELDKKFNNL